MTTTKMRWILPVLAAVLLTPLAAGSDPVPLTHGPILGRISDHGVGVWARTERPGSFAVRYGPSAGGMDTTTEPVHTRIEHDNAAWIHITGLKPDTRYDYELVLAGTIAPTGRSGSFRTLPADEDYRHAELNPKGLFNFSFEFGCGNNQNLDDSVGPGFPAMKTMLDQLRDEIHFAILNGDWLYESHRSYRPSQWAAQVDVALEDLPTVVQVAPTIVGVWENYKQFLSQSENLARWHRQIPSFFVYDDHEMLNDIWGAGSPGLRDRRAVFRDIGVRAWYDYLGWSNPTDFTQPVHFGEARLQAGSDVLTDPQADFGRLDLSQTINLHVHWGTDTAGVNDNALDGVGGDPNAGVYRIVEILGKNRLRIDPPADQDGRAAYSIGRRSYYHMRIANSDFFLTDTRGHREMHDIRTPDKPGLSMLGTGQREWLMEGIRKSDADFIFVLSSVNFMVPHVGGGGIVRTSNKDDAWTVFLDEREKLIDFFDSQDKPVFVLTGDLHNSFVIRITDNVWEMASGPHNSTNHWVTDEGDRPANGSFKYGPREVDIRWSTSFRSDIPREYLLQPTFCVVQVNNVFNNPRSPEEKRWVAYPRPQVIFRYYDGRTGAFSYAESILATAR